MNAEDYIKSYETLKGLGVTDPKDFLEGVTQRNAGYSITPKGREYKESLDSKINRQYDKRRSRELVGNYHHHDPTLSKYYKRLTLFLDLDEGWGPLDHTYGNRSLTPKQQEIVGRSYQRELNLMEKEGLVRKVDLDERT